MSGEQAEERTAREGRIERAMKWVRGDEGRAAYLLAYNKTAHLSSPHPWVPNLLAAYAEAECSRLASRVEELERLLRNGLECQPEGCVSWEKQVREFLGMEE